MPLDVTPDADLKERIKKTLSSCKGVLEDHFKKKTFLQFLEAFISHIVTALAGENKPENAKEFKDLILKNEKLENEIQLRENTIHKYKYIS